MIVGEDMSDDSGLVDSDDEPVIVSDKNTSGAGEDIKASELAVSTHAAADAPTTERQSGFS